MRFTHSCSNMFRSKKLVVALSLATCMVLFHQASLWGLLAMEMPPSNTSVWLCKSAAWVNPLVSNSEMNCDQQTQDASQHQPQVILNTDESTRKEGSSLTPVTGDENDSSLPSQPTDLPPRRQHCVVTKYSISGMGNKLSDTLFGIQYAKDNNLTYLFNYESFIENNRQADYRWAAELLASRYPRYNEAEHQLYHVDDLFVLPRMSPEDQEKYDGYFIDMRITCGRADCFNPGVSHYLNNTRDLEDLLGVTSENREYRVAIHLRFGDITHHLEPNQYLRIVEGLDKKYRGESSDDTMSLMDRVHVVYYIPNNGQHPVLDEIKALFPKVEFHNEENVETTMRLMAESEFLITSPSSLSYMAAYMCGDCHVVYTRPKEWIYGGTVMTPENYKNNIFYKEGWEPDFNYLQDSLL